MTFNCNSCGQPITFNARKYKSEKSGKAIPLDVETETPHNCPAKIQAYQQSKQAYHTKQAYPDTAREPEPHEIPSSEENDETFDQKFNAFSTKHEERDAKIEKSFDKKMDAYEQLTNAIIKLGTSIDMNTAAISKSNQLREMDSLGRLGLGKNDEPKWDSGADQ